LRGRPRRRHGWKGTLGRRDFSINHGWKGTLGYARDGRRESTGDGRWVQRTLGSAMDGRREHGVSALAMAGGDSAWRRKCGVEKGRKRGVRAGCSFDRTVHHPPLWTPTLDK
jgi:hypothetical protein